MIDTYDSKSCSVHQKIYYHPIDAALRWCNLISQEEYILSKTKDTSTIKPHDFPQWPCLKNNYDRIIYAIQSGELAHGRDGRTVRTEEHVAASRLTVTHADLKEWMSKNHPGQKPSFLFDEVERQLHSAITKDAYLALQAENDKLKGELELLKDQLRESKSKNELLLSENTHLKGLIDSLATPRNENLQDSNLAVIGAMLGTMKELKRRQGMSSAGLQANIISGMVEHFSKIKGISTSSLEKKFAEANRYIEQSLE